MAIRLLTVVLYSYLVSGIMLAPLVIIASAMHMSISRDLVAKMIGWGAASIVFVLYLKALGEQLL